MLMSASLLRATATWTLSALTPRDRFRAGADLVTKAMVLNVFVSCFVSPLSTPHFWELTVSKVVILTGRQRR